MPRVPVRQWVLTVPFGLRFGMAFDPALAGVVLRIFVGVVSRWLRRRARAHGIRGTLETGGVPVIQRFGSALNLNVHFHTLMIDGVYQLAPSGAAVFHPVPAPTDEDVAAVAEHVYRKVARLPVSRDRRSREVTREVLTRIVFLAERNGGYWSDQGYEWYGGV